MSAEERGWARRTPGTDGIFSAQLRRPSMLGPNLPPEVVVQTIVNEPQLVQFVTSIFPAVKRFRTLLELSPAIISQALYDRAGVPHLPYVRCGV